MGITRGGRLLVLAATALSAMATALVMAPSSQALDGPPDQVGQWGPVLDWGVQGKHMVLLNTGNVLVWSAGDQARIWNPITQQFTLTPAPFGDVHCASQVTLADGRVLVAGGQNVTTHIGIPVTSIFNPQTSTWSRGADMAYSRWYPTLTTLPDGRALVVSGDATNGNRIDTPEIYDPVADTWTPKAKKLMGLYPFMYVLPNGKIYEAGTNTSTSFFDTSGAGAWSSGPAAKFGSSAYSESGAMYEPGKIFRAGGGDPAMNRTQIIDMNAANPQWEETAPMAFPRRRMNTPVLADGSIMAVGGTRQSDDAAQAILDGEIWNPQTKQWTTVAAMTQARMYHSTALLLPDGRVVTAGGESTGRLTAQVYSPPYLFKGQRPTITASPASTGYGATFTLGTDANDITKVALIRPSGVTHAIDMNQRYVPLSFSGLGTQLTVTAPPTANHAPPGDYMLVAVNSRGVPSVAKWVHLGGGAAPPPPAPVAAFSGTPVSGTAPLAVSFSDASTGSPTSWAWDFDNDGTVDSTAQNPLFTYSNPGTYSVTLTVANAGGSNAVTKTGYISVAAPSPGAPVAAFSGTPVSGTAPLAVAFSDASTGSPTSWAWDFDNDGTVDSTAQNPTFTYSTPGTYSVKLTVGNGTGGDSLTKSNYVSVGSGTTPGTQTLTPVADAHVKSTGATKNYGTDASLRLRQGTSSTDTYNSYLKFAIGGLGGPPSAAMLRLYVTDASPDGGSVFAVGSSWTETGLTWTNRPAIGGSSLASAGPTTVGKWVELNVTSAITPAAIAGGFVSFALTTTSSNSSYYASREAANKPQLVIAGSGAPPSTGAPVAAFSGTPVSGTAPLAVSFTDSSTGSPTTWAWDFDNNGTVDSTVQNPTFTYTSPGAYAVKLTVGNGAGTDSVTKTGYITVGSGTTPGTQTLTPVADAHVKSTSATKNYGADTSLRLRQGTTASPDTYNSYLKFDIGGLGGPPSSAVLRLYVTDASPDGGSVFAVDSSWNETGLTWTNRPPVGAGSLASAGATAVGQWVELNVTPAITPAAIANGFVSFALTTTSSNSSYYASREATNKPQLVLTPSATPTVVALPRSARAGTARAIAAVARFVCPLEAGSRRTTRA